MLTLVALDLHATVHVHPLVPAQVGELRVSLAANFAPEGLHARVDMLVLLEAAACCKGLAALTASVTPGPNVLRPNVALEIRRIRKDFLATFANVSSALVVRNLVSDQVRLPVEDLWALIALEVALGVSVSVMVAGRMRSARACA